VLVSRIPEFLDGLSQRLRAEKADLLEKVSGGDWEDATVEELDAAIKEYADDFGYDLDEDGNPTDDGGDSDRVTTRAREDVEEADEADETEKEAATA
jgi:F-type H+/Na+-transporting ATPase subunit alpha